MANLKGLLHSGYFNDTLRSWQCSNTEIGPHNLMLPIFISDQDDTLDGISTMPNVYRFGKNRVKEYLDPLYQLGLKSVLLFGVINDSKKDENGSNADSINNPVIQIIPLLKKWFPELTVVCDVCLCGYTSHGHCGLLNENNTINNSKSIHRLAEVATAYALAGADIVAPSDMMDGRIRQIKLSLLKNQLNQVAILSYSVKFASCFYGPFRDAAHSAPGFGDRKQYQLPPGSKGLSDLCAARDIEEGCDFLMVKPSLPYLDIVKQIKQSYPSFPLFVYQVSGEYAMLYQAAKSNCFDLRKAVEETLISMRRAGADCIITYFTPQVLEWLKEK